MTRGREIARKEYNRRLGGKTERRDAMSSVNTFMTSALVWLVIVVLVAGLVMGLAFAGTDLLNLPTAKAEAGDIERASRHQEQVDEINLKYYEQERQAQADERKEQYHQETEFQGLA